MSSDSAQPIQKIGFWTTVSFVVANMIGTGVFTSLGFQLNVTENIITILLLWILGGIIALSGALVYGELGAAMPRSGGEYHYLSVIYRPWVGFLSGWVSLTVGFAAPVALAAMALGSYTARILPSLSPQNIALSVLLFITLIHALDVRLGAKFQLLFTSFKVLLILVFIICGLLLTENFQNFGSSFQAFNVSELSKPGFYISLIYVTYAFSGWNASAYIASEIERPQRNLPLSLLVSTLLVTLLYFLLNFTFLLTTPTIELKGQLDVGYISAAKIFGSAGGRIMAILISILLISTVSSMIFVGPRVTQVMGEDYKILGFLAERSKRGTPVFAILLQFTISFFMILTSTFESVLTYAGFTLNLFTFLTVLGVFIHRKKFKTVQRPYKTWGYPYVPLIYLLVILLTLIYLIVSRPYESLMGFITLFSGIIIYLINLWYIKKNEQIA
ncbi:MAG: amino acid permease [Bacteroidales bacterium]|nr:amino acid permease [Bacteroidales bacterium]